MRIDTIIWLPVALLLGLASCNSGSVGPQHGSDSATSFQPKAATWPANSDVVSVIINISGMPTNGTDIVVERYYWDKFVLVTQLRALNGADQLFQLKDNYGLGLYRLFPAGAADTRPIYFIVNGQDEKLTIKTLYADMLQGKAEIMPNDEVFALNEVIQLHRKRMEIEEELKAQATAVSNINPRYFTLKDSLRDEIERNKLAFYDQLDIITETYPGTYVNKAVVRMLRKANRFEDRQLFNAYETEPAMLNDHYFDGLDIDHTAYLGHPVFFQSVNEYISQYAGEQPSEWGASIPTMMEHISEPGIRQLVAEYLVFYYLDRSQDSLATELAFAYIEGCTDDYIANLKQSDRYRSGPQPNNPMPPLKLPDTNGNEVDVAKVAAESQLTLLYFWKTGCTYCEAEHLNIKRLNDLYADKGLQVVGVSLDMDRQNWLSSIKEHRMDWLNLCDLKGTSSANIYEYAVKGTPAVFIITNKGILLTKDITGTDLNELIKLYFAKKDQQ